MSKGNILVVGAAGQIGVELVIALRNDQSRDIIASDLHAEVPSRLAAGRYEQLDILDKSRLNDIVQKYGITQIYLLAAKLSALAEKDPLGAWSLNMDGLLNVLELARSGAISKIFWPSSIAVFGPTTPQQNTPQQALMEPTSVYGISKLAGERWCEYYFSQYGVDVRSLRYPGLISSNSQPGGGTTDYAVDIFHKALEAGNYSCFLGPYTFLPMMHMQDAVRATMELMNCPGEKVQIRSSYNIASMTFSPVELADEIKKLIPKFQISYSPDFRQAIADSWPESIDDSAAKEHWGWEDKYNIETLVQDMVYKLREIKEIV